MVLNDGLYFMWYSKGYMHGEHGVVSPDPLDRLSHDIYFLFLLAKTVFLFVICEIKS